MAEPINLLSLDGGGIRGISEAIILDDLMNRIKTIQSLPTVPRPCEYFHLIGGTSTGGLLAIMLGRLRMTTAEAIKAYDSCSAVIFKRRKNLIGNYSGRKLEMEVKKMVQNKKMGEAMLDEKRTIYHRGHSFVCTVDVTQPTETIPFRSYKHENGTDGRPPTVMGGAKQKVVEVMEEDKVPRNLQIWEAARATTAAPNFFKRARIGGRDYIDGAVHINNPADRVLLEARQLFGADRELGCIVSIGTGLTEVTMSKSGRLRGVDLVQIFKLMINAVSDAEPVHNRLQKRFTEYQLSYSRFNIGAQKKKIKLNHYKAMDQMKQLTREYIREDEIASRLDMVAKTLAEGLTERLTLEHACHPVPARPEPLARREGAVSNFFTGREDILGRLEQFFQSREPFNGPRRQFMLGGMGGVGKTQIALKFRQDFDHHFPGGVFWIDGANEITIDHSYKMILRDYFNIQDESKITAAEGLRKLENLEEDWIILFDNCWERSITGFLPRGSNGNILYTTRYKELSTELPAGCFLEVEPLGKDVAADLLFKVSGTDDIDAQEKGRRTVEDIVLDLGYLPLGIDIFGKYMRGTNYEYVEYIAQLHRKQEELRQTTPGVFADVSATVEAICASFDLS